LNEVTLNRRAYIALDQYKNEKEVGWKLRAYLAVTCDEGREEKNRDDLIQEK